MNQPDITRNLLILRHAKSDWHGPAVRDFDRPLSKRGRRAAAAMGAYMAENCPVPDLVLCSAARRATETWQIIEDCWPSAPKARYARELYNASADALLLLLNGMANDIRGVALIGHHPGFDGLAIGLSADQDSDAVNDMRMKYPTGALAQLSFDGAWKELRPEAAKLVRFVKPRELD